MQLGAILLDLSLICSRGKFLRHIFEGLQLNSPSSPRFGMLIFDELKCCLILPAL